MRGTKSSKGAKGAKPPVRRAKTRIEASSGNVFADLGLANPELALAKAQLVQRIRALIAERKLTQAAAAGVLGLDQPKVSALVRGRVEGYSLDRLFRLLNVLGQQIEITVAPRGKDKVSADRAITVTL